jgi:formylglycine-generating enzyme required for sulfatase activity
MSRFEITRAQFSARMGTDPSAASYSGGTSDPVQTVNWYHAIAFCNKLSLAESLTPAYSVSVGGAPVNWSTLSYGSIPTAGNSDWDAATVNWDANGYRLPTETEWMWAAMGAPAAGLGGDTDTAGYAKAFAGSTGSNAIGDYAVFGYDSGETGATTLLRSSSFGSKLANELGLYDMSGNVWELCWDLYGSYPSGTLTDYRGAASGATRVTRGGSWWNGAGACQMTDRGATTPSETFFARGFRVVRR